MDAKPSSNQQINFPMIVEACRLIASLQSRNEEQAVAMELKDKLVAEQAHSVLQLKDVNDKLEEKNVELTFKVEKLLEATLRTQRANDASMAKASCSLDLGEEATPEVVSALGRSGPRSRRQVVEAAEAEEKATENPNLLARTIASFPAHLPRIERIVDLPEASSERA